jgi:hypothetical protein
MTDSTTPNFNLILPAGNRRNWTDLANGNFRIIDALIATYVAVSNLQGLWTNNTEYEVGDNVIDETSGVVYTAQVEHVSSSAPTTFIQERAAHSTYWTTFAVAARNRGTWATATAYALNDFVLADGTKYAMCISPHTSGANFTADLALGRWTVLIDLSSAGSLVLPTLSGLVDADKIVITNSSGVAYSIAAIVDKVSLFIAAGLAPTASPALTGVPTAPTVAAESNDTSIATANYADRAVRNIAIRRQVFDVTGTYTPDSKLIYAIAEAWGAGGGGGGATSAVGVVGVGGGGGAGSYSNIALSPAQIGASKAVTIGAFGAAGAAGNNAGGNGGDTSLGALLVAKGGTGGAGSAGAVGGTLSAGGLGGIAGTGDITTTGMSGGSGGASGAFIVSGHGGSTSIGGGGNGVMSPTNAPGISGTGKGSGGSGATSSAGSGAVGGGTGQGGRVVVTEICYG